MADLEALFRPVKDSSKSSMIAAFSRALALAARGRQTLVRTFRDSVSALVDFEDCSVLGFNLNVAIKLRLSIEVIPDILNGEDGMKRRKLGRNWLWSDGFASCKGQEEIGRWKSLRVGDPRVRGNRSERMRRECRVFVRTYLWCSDAAVERQVERLDLRCWRSAWQVVCLRVGVEVEECRCIAEICKKGIETRLWV